MKNFSSIFLRCFTSEKNYNRKKIVIKRSEKRLPKNNTKNSSPQVKQLSSSKKTQVKQVKQNTIDTSVPKSTNSLKITSQIDYTNIFKEELGNKYQFVEILGEGTYGIVFKCIRKSDGQLVAIKSCKQIRRKKNIGISPLTLKQLGALKKTKNTKYSIKLHQFNITSIKVQEDKLIFVDSFVFQYAQFSLKNILDKSKLTQTKISLNTKLLYIKQLILGVNQIHQLNIVHRDLKPANILITFDQEKQMLKISDFGTAISKLSHNQTMSSYGVGTLWYQPPEVLFRVEEYGHQYDLWSLGVLIYEIITGEVPFKKYNIVDQIHSIFEQLGGLNNNNCVDYYQKMCPNKENNILELSDTQFSHNLDTMREKIKTEIKQNDEISNISSQISSLLFDLLRIDPRTRIPTKQLIQKYQFLRKDFT